MTSTYFSPNTLDLGQGGGQVSHGVKQHWLPSKQLGQELAPCLAERTFVAGQGTQSDRERSLATTSGGVDLPFSGNRKRKKWKMASTNTRLFACMSLAAKFW